MKIVPHARKRVTSDARTEDVFQSDGCVILKTIVVTIQMKLTISVMEVIESVPNLNSVVETTNAFPTVGDVITTTIVEMEQMNKLAKIINVELENSNVILDTASRKN
jgi:hypothetical protein